MRRLAVWKRGCAIFGIGLAMTSCASSLKQSFEELRVGTSKDQVLESLGNPKATLRRSGRDVWTYRFFDGDREVVRHLVFENQAVVHISEPQIGHDAQDQISRDVEAFFANTADSNDGRGSKFRDIQDGN